jgi:hypothetical protein
VSTIGYRLVAAFTIILSAVIVFAGVAALAHFWIGASAGDGIMMGGFAGACAGIGAGIAFVESGGDGD